MSATERLLGMAYEMQGMKLGIERIHALHQELGSPASTFRSVHVGGTNGKGSVAGKIASALQQQGYRVGLYTSPHISDIRERICINGVSIGALDPTLERLLPLKMTYFETLTLAAFLLFAEARVDYAVIEVGLGGRLDATNILIPELSVITSIGWDHMAYLGTTLAAIAYEKAGIIKRGVPVVLGPTTHPRSVFEEVATAREAPLFYVEGNYAHFEEENRALAAAACRCLHIPPLSIESVPPCRFEQHGSLILDVGHNRPALHALFARVRATFPNKPLRVVAAFSADKEVEALCTFVKNQTPHVHFTQAPHPRAHNFGTPGLEETFKHARALSQRNDEILVACGTFFMMSVLKKIISSE